MQETQQVISTGWIENLAIEEINMDESGVIQFNEHLNPNSLLEEASIQMMDELRDRFEVYTTKFNEYRMTSGNGVRIFKISNTVNDFMLFRNSLKLIVARRSNDLIAIGFISNSGGQYSARTTRDFPAKNSVHEIRAQIGAFGKISWKFDSETIDVDALVKHYLTEFVKHSAR